MAVNVDELAKNEFWRRKMLTVCSTHDLNRDYHISRADYTIILHRYKQLGASDQHLKKMEACIAGVCKSLGLSDDSTKLTYEQCVANFGRLAGANLEDIVKGFDASFQMIDSNSNGEISFDEWVKYYQAMGIDTVYARASFDSMDADGDGIVSKDEFVAYNREFFHSAEDKLNSSILFGPLH